MYSNYSISIYTTIYTRPCTLPSWSYRTLHHGRDSSPTDISSHMLQTISEEVRAAVVGAEDFMASDGLVVTWYRFTHRTANCMSSTCPV